MTKPLVGITANYTTDSRIGTELHIGGPGQQWNLLAADYIHAVERAGGLPVIVPVSTDRAATAALVRRLDGIVFSGGSDVDPALYGQAPAGALPSQPQRDAHEVALLQDVLQHTALPVLCVCRGCQLFNAVLGGTLYQDLEQAGLPRHSLNQQPMGETTHDIKILPGTLLASILGAGQFPVNSFHHQSVRQNAPGVITSAVAAGCAQVIEAVELPARAAFTLAVQWHPEALVDTQPSSLAVWQALIHAANG